MYKRQQGSNSIWFWFWRPSIACCSDQTQKLIHWATSDASEFYWTTQKVFCSSSGTTLLDVLWIHTTCQLFKLLSMLSCIYSLCRSWFGGKLQSSLGIHEAVVSNPCSLMAVCPSHMNTWHDSGVGGRSGRHRKHKNSSSVCHLYQLHINGTWVVVDREQIHQRV